MTQKKSDYKNKANDTRYIKQFIRTFFAAVLVFVFSLISFLSVIPAASAENIIAGKIAELKGQNVFKKEFKIFTIAPERSDAEITKVVSRYTLVDLDQSVTSEIKNTKPDYLKLVIPVDGGTRNLTLLLYKVNISPNGLILLTSDGLPRQEDNQIVHYRGSIDNDNHSVASISISDNETMGLVCNDEGNYVLGKIKNNSAGKYIIYNDKYLSAQSNFSCEAGGPIPQNHISGNNLTLSNSTLSAKCVNFYWETDYDVYISLGSVANVNSYLQGVFNQVSTLYANDSMTINLQTVFIWTTTDPYTGPSAGAYAIQFGTYSNFLVNSPSKGDLATLIGFAGNSGYAYNGSLCYNRSPGLEQYSMAYCGVNSSYANVPTYSWTVENIAHENGHNIGSRHTHACVWNGNNTAIDGCATTEGGCPGSGLPSGGGTIMSYCHLTGAGINLNLGFGPQPKALLLGNINSASCLSACSGCPLPAQPGTITGSASACPASSQTYSVAVVTGATSYTWTLPSGWSGSSTTNSITATAGSTGGSMSVTANNSCGSSIARTLAVVVSTTAPAQPGTISGSASVCPGSSQTYSVIAVTGATSYSWTLPSGWTGSSTSNSIAVNAGSSGGTISVTANNSCGNSIARTLAVTTGGTVPSQPGTISGNSSMCPGSSQTFSINAVTGAINYSWTLPTGWSGSSTTNSITVITGSSGGTISVIANNSCGSSIARTTPVTVSTAAPAQPGAISGSASVCPNSSQTYSVAAVTGVTSYTWILPTGWLGSSSTNSITVLPGTTGSTISVKANNICGSSLAQTFAVAVSATAAAQPGAISGSISACPNSSQTYSVSAVTGATNYTWTLPTSWTGSSTTNSITTVAGNTGGTLSVIANNSCGSSTARTLAVTTGTTAPAQPGAISGNASVCQGTVQTYSVSVVPGATSYTWTRPSGWSGASTTNSITLTAGSAGGSISVKANNTCGSSIARTFAVAVTHVPSQPGTITGNISSCQGSLQSYSLTAVTGATSYTWTLPTGWSGSSTTNSITVTPGASGGNISVKANNGCGSSTARTKSVTVTRVPNQPGAISGNISVCPGSSQTYAINNVTGATSYTWTLPSDWSGSSTGNSITVDVGNSGNSISVTANNSCGSSAAKSLSLTVHSALNISLYQNGNYIVVSPVGSTDHIQWYYQNTLVAGVDDSLLCLGMGNYFCTVTNSYGCLNTSLVFNVNSSAGPTGMIENPSSDFMIFPNPASDFIRVRDVDQNKKTGFQFCLFNVEGKKILETKINEPSAVVDIKNILSGFYFYRVMNGSVILQSGKLIVLKTGE